MSADFLKVTELNGNVVNMRMDTVRSIRMCVDETCPDHGNLLVFYDWLDMSDPRRPVPIIAEIHVQPDPGLLGETVHEHDKEPHEVPMRVTDPMYTA